MPSLDISIPSASTNSTGAKPYTAYTIQIRAPLRTRSLQKRYSDFVTLDKTLRAQTNAAPPAPLPAKSWFARTVGNDALTEERRKGLEAYLRAIDSSPDDRWRRTPAWRAFLELPEEGSGKSKVLGNIGLTASGGVVVDAATWLDMYGELKNQLREARLYLTKREQAQQAQAQHEAGANAKGALVQASALIRALEEGLKGLSGGGRNGDEGAWGGVEKLGDGEIRRRRDMIGSAKKERDGLESVLSAMSVKNAASTSSSLSGTTAIASEGDKQGLFKGGAPGGRGRVLGAPAKETERTRELDNEGVLQLQRQIMQEQDEDVQDLTKVVRRMREMGVAINEELVLQNQMLDLLDNDVDRVQGKIDVARKRVDKIR
ncbi:hypothetical protein W97_02772 [Coniosporium apollinis CBS 100218]|uniref:PX domain-containing protein n=1 Tax=Coniosporium apollinis (strain CBS 100218) TaxID=1168221 RepID=R7YP00_CONA1|nr:uncharacterized protein W97_02772 [Coniosporium apollinis CBS 100218]EON63544.1 hypothetical protein W97_02772 [Coniosporium apollinis CBS 100218]